MVGGILHWKLGISPSKEIWKTYLHYSSTCLSSPKKRGEADGGLFFSNLLPDFSHMPSTPQGVRLFQGSCTKKTCRWVPRSLPNIWQLLKSCNSISIASCFLFRQVFSSPSHKKGNSLPTAQAKVKENNVWVHAPDPSVFGTQIILSPAPGKHEHYHDFLPN